MYKQFPKSLTLRLFSQIAELTLALAEIRDGDGVGVNMIIVYSQSQSQNDPCESIPRTR